MYYVYKVHRHRQVHTHARTPSIPVSLPPVLVRAQSLRSSGRRAARALQSARGCHECECVADSTVHIAFTAKTSSSENETRYGK